MGALLKFQANKEILKNVTAQTKLDLFSSYFLQTAKHRCGLECVHQYEGERIPVGQSGHLVNLRRRYPDRW